MSRRWIRLAMLAGFAALAAYFADRSRRTPQLETLESAPAVQAEASAENFDFFVLALSWSPSYCAAKGGDADPQQCALSKPLGFAAHGLWPQNERGYARHCAVGAADSVDRGILRDIKAVMPSSGLARHEWRKHGACSGLGQKDYFQALLAAVGKVRIPDMFKQMPSRRELAPRQVETAFLQSNPGMSAKGFAAVCEGGYLTEVRVCMTKQLKFRECPEVDRKACRAASVEMPPAL